MATVVGVTITVDIFIDIVNKNNRSAIIDLLKEEAGRIAIKNLMNNNLENALMIACSQSRETDIINALIDSGLFNPGDTNKSGETALMIACKSSVLRTEKGKNNNRDVALAILNTGAYQDTDKHREEFEQILSMCLSSNTNDLNEVALALIAKSENGTRFSIDLPNKKYGNGDTPFISACVRGNEQAILALLATGAVDVNRLNNNGLTSLMLLLNKGMINTIYAIIATGKSNYATYRDVYGRTFLAVAIISRNVELVKFLILTGAVDLRSAPLVFVPDISYKWLISRWTTDSDVDAMTTESVLNMIDREIAITDEVSRQFMLLKTKFKEEVDKRLAEKIKFYEEGH